MPANDTLPVSFSIGEEIHKGTKEPSNRISLSESDGEKYSVPSTAFTTSAPVCKRRVTIKVSHAFTELDCCRSCNSAAKEVVGRSRRTKKNKKRRRILAGPG